MPHEAGTMSNVVRGYQTHWEGVVTAQNYANNTPGTASNIVTAFSRTFQMDDFNVMGVLDEQFTKLSYYMNMYERYRLAKIQVDFFPRWTEQVSYTGPPIAVPADTVSNDMYECIMMHDNEDAIVRTANLNEYYQVRVQDNAKRFKSTDSATLILNPKVLKPVSLSDITTGDGSAVADLRLGPSPCPWLATKVFVSTGVYALPSNQQFYAFKMYIYNPYFPATYPAATFPDVLTIIGTVAYTYFWEFTDFDNRAIVAAVGLKPPSDLDREIYFNKRTGVLSAFPLAVHYKNSLNPLKRALPLSLVTAKDHPQMADDVPQAKKLPNRATPESRRL